MVGAEGLLEDGCRRWHDRNSGIDTVVLRRHVRYA